MKSHVPKFAKLTLTLIALSGLALGPLQAENVFITGWKGTSSTLDKMPCPPSCVAGFATIGAGNASASQVSPVPIIPNNARRVHYGNSEAATWDLTPMDIVMTPSAPAGTGPYTNTALQNIGVYKIYLTKGQDGNASTNIVVQMTATENGSPAQLADTNGNAASTILLNMFQKGKPNHVWVHVGYITNTIASPTITLKWFSGAINDTDAANQNAQRWYTDAIRFEYLDQCAGVSGQVNVAGPLVQNQTFVNVFDVVAGATNVTVYANNLTIGQTNSPTGFAAGALTVNTTVPLVQGDRITAGQIKNGCFSLVPGTGPAVGGGANAQLRAFLSCWKNVDFQGPVGANTTSNTTVNYFLKATGLIAAFGTAPTGGEVLSPSGCWQTVTFNHATDAGYLSTGGAIQNTDPFCALAGLLFTLDTADSGPYDIYVDQIKNGETIIENFEGYAPGTTNTFNKPNAAPAPAPAATYLSSPNSSVIVQNNVFDGTNALRIRWQWSDASNLRWAHILANASTNSGKYYPQLDTTQPITVRYLVLPVGESTNKVSYPTVPVSQTKAPGQNVSFSVQAAGEGPFLYQWQFAGTDLTGETNSVYAKNNVQEGDAGIYSVVVTGAGGTGCSSTNSASLTIATQPPALNYSVSANQITLTWAGSFTLQSNTNLTSGTWADVTSTSGYSEPIGSDQKYFRLRQ